MRTAGSEAKMSQLRMPYRSAGNGYIPTYKITYAHPQYTHRCTHKRSIPNMHNATTHYRTHHRCGHKTRIGLPGPDQTEIAAKVSAKARELGGTTSVRREQISEVASRRVTKDKYLRQALLWWAAGEPDVWPIPATPPSSSSSAASS
jgi:hypothetical protein